MKNFFFVICVSLLFFFCSLWAKLDTLSNSPGEVLNAPGQPQVQHQQQQPQVQAAQVCTSDL